jgi:hypothetical protein
MDFTFTNTTTATVVAGEIDGLTMGGTSSAFAISIPGSGYTIGPIPPYLFPTPPLMSDGTTNTFPLDGSGAITPADFMGEGFFDTKNGQ